VSDMCSDCYMETCSLVFNESCKKIKDCIHRENTSSNRPFEWSGRHHPVLRPPQALCLPLKGSVSSPADLPERLGCYADRVINHDKARGAPQPGYKWRASLWDLKRLASYTAKGCRVELLRSAETLLAEPSSSLSTAKQGRAARIAE
jgi:hypothetical protein